MVPWFGPHSDSRRVSRARVQLPARYVSASLTLEGYVTDVSSDGLFFRSEYLDEQGELARLLIEIPSRAERIELRGEVRWVNDSPRGGMGIRFIDLSLEDRMLLIKVVRALQPDGEREAPGTEPSREGNA